MIAGLARVMSTGFALRMAGLGLGFGIGLLLARGLGPEAYGIYGTALSTLVILGVCAECGLPTLVTRESSVSADNGRWSLFLGVRQFADRSVMLLSALLLCALAGALAAGLVNTALTTTLLAGAALIPLVSLERNASAVLRGLGFMVAGQVSEVIVRPLCVLAVLLLVWQLGQLALTPPLVMVVQVCAAALALWVSRRLLHRSLPTEALSTVAEQRVQLWRRAAFPMAISEGARVLQGHLVIIVLAALAGAAAVGSFRVAVSISMLIVMPLTLANLVFMPLFARAHAAEDSQQLQSLTRLAVLCMVAAVGLLSLPFLIMGEQLVVFAFGTQYAQAVGPLKILCVGQLAGAAFGASVALLNMSGNEREVSRFFVFALMVLLITSPPLVLMYNQSGAAVAVALSQLVLAAGLWWRAKVLLDVDASFLSLSHPARPLRVGS